MPTTRRQRWPRHALIAAIVLLAAWLLWSLHRTGGTDAVAYWSLVVAVLGLLVTLVPLVRGPGAERAAEGADQAHDQLAAVVAAQWKGAAAERGLVQPEALPVRWCLDRALAGPAAAALGSSAFDVLPGYEPLDEHVLERGGDVHELHRIVGALTSGRLVVAGAPGSGKSAAAVLLVVDLLRHRAELPPPDRRAFPVPVLLAVGGWDPHAQTVQDWVVEQLRQTYDPLFAGRGGAVTAERLLTGGRIAVVLDGLDEMPARLRPDAVDQLNRTSTWRVVVTGRREELRATADRQILLGAVALGLEPVTAPTAAGYLAATRAAATTSRWSELVDHLRRTPDSPLARALDTPLMLTLVYDGLREGPAVDGFLALCEARPLPEPRVLEGYLLDRLVETVYRPHGPEPPSVDVDTAQRTLRWLAARMDAEGVRELAWWHLPRWGSRVPRAVVVGLVTPLAMFGLDLSGLAWQALTLVRGLAVLVALGAVVGALAVADRARALPLRRNRALGRPGPALAYGAALGCLSLSGVVATGSSALVLVLAAVSLIGGAGLTARRYLRGARPRRWTGPSAAASFLFGLAAGWLAVGVGGLWLTFDQLLLVLLAVGVVGAVLTLRLGLSDDARPDDDTPSSPLASYRRGRSTEAVGWCLLAVACGVMAMVAFVDLEQVDDTLGSVALGFAVLSGAALGMIFPESWLVAVTGAQLALRHGTPVRLVGFLDDARARGVLRAVGPLYEFRHGHLQDRLAQAAPAGSERYPRAVEVRALHLLRERTCGGGDGPCRLAWWRIPTLVAAAPRTAAVGLAAGTVTWLGLALLAPPEWPTGASWYVAAATAAGAALGAHLFGRTLAAPTTVPRTWESTVRRPVAVGVVVGMAFSVELVRTAPGLMSVFLVALAAGAALWALVGATLAVTGRGPAVLRWRRVGRDTPRLLRLFVGVCLGYVVLLTAAQVLPPVVTVLLYLLSAVVVIALVLRQGLRREVLCAAGGPTVEAFASWGRHRAAQLTLWLVGGGLLTGFVTRVWAWSASANGLAEGDQRGPLGVAVVVALVCGLALGTTFPVTWLLSLACVQLRIRHGLPIRLMRLLRDARDRGAVRTVGAEFEL